MSQPQPVRAGDVYPPSAAATRPVANRTRSSGKASKSVAKAAASRSPRPTSPAAGASSPPASAARYTICYHILTYVPRSIVTFIWSLECHTMLSLIFYLQVLAQFTVPACHAVTVGEALQAAASDRPVTLADAAVVQAVEMRATGLGGNLPGGVAAAAQRAAEGKAAVRMRDVVGDVAAALPADKVATREDAEKVAAASARNEGRRAGSGRGKGSGVVEAVAAAADMNEGRMK
ncbi:unnamed protein product [Urochloa decumbens]|uniref:SMP domain-containing protein n=1 Tax=Urochloa decumbens TaxID=240449 RepID=A0ABC8ZYK0_9POAL